MYQKVVKKEKGPAPPPPSMPNSNSVAPSIGPKESGDGKIATESNVEESDSKPNQKEIIETPTSTTPDDTPSQPEVIEFCFFKIACHFNIGTVKLI